MHAQMGGHEIVFSAHRGYVSKNEVDLAVVIDGAGRFSSTGAVDIWRGREEFDAKPIYTM